MASDYLFLLTNLSQRLSKDDIDNLVFSCGHAIPKSAAERIATGIHLFQELKQRGHLGPGNYGYLSKHLVLIGRHDLASMLPDETDILFGRSTVRDKGYFGCCVSPSSPESGDETSLVSPSVLKFCHPQNESRVLLMCLSEHLSAEDVKKLAFLMFPSHTHGCLTAIELAQLIEREGGLNSIGMITQISSSLEAVGRMDLASLFYSLKASQVSLGSNSLSTSNQQLNLKMSLFVHSKLRSYDFYMRALNEVENDNNVRAKLLSPLAKKAKKFFDPATISPFAESIKAALQSGHVHGNYEALIRTSLLEALKANQAYVGRLAGLDEGKQPCVDKLCSLRDEGYESYKSFNSIMDTLDWNSAIRSEFKNDIHLRRSPFGTPAELACQYILELCKEVSQCSDHFLKEMEETDKHLLALNSDYFSCCYHVITLQWLASLLCVSTSSDGTLLDLSKYRDILQHVVEQKKGEIVEQYDDIAEIVGLDTLQHLIPPSHDNKPHTNLSVNPFLLLFNVLTIKLLVVATLGQDNFNIQDVELSFMQLGQKFCNQVVIVASNMIRVSAAAMKKEVEAFREKMLSEDQLCSRVIAALTLDSS